MHNVKSIPTQGLQAIRDLIVDCEAAVQCVYLATSALENKDAYPIQYVLSLASGNLEMIREMLTGGENNA